MQKVIILKKKKKTLFSTFLSLRNFVKHNMGTKNFVKQNYSYRIQVIPFTSHFAVLKKALLSYSNKKKKKTNI
jgi:hypothetical protein